MKKLLALLMVLLIVPSFMVFDALAASDSFDTGDVMYTAPYSKEFSADIVPNIQLIDPGSIKVTISWSAPSLTFDKKMMKDNNGNDVRYYALNTPQTVAFNVENRSIQGTQFDGTIYVIPGYSRVNDPNEVRSSNIRVFMSKQDTEISLAKGNSANSVTLEYLNVTDTYLAKDKPETLLNGSATVQEIKDIMTTKVTFKISTTKK